LIYNPFTMKKNRLLFLLLLAMPFAVSAQDIGELLEGNVADAKYVSEGYISPMMKALGYGLNQGWYNTAKPHNFPGFDLTFSVNPVFVPAADKIFKVNNQTLTSFSLVTDMDGKTIDANGTGNIPTVLGADKSTTYRMDTAPNGTFNGPGGIGINFFPTPTLNLGIGLPKGTDLKVRFVPTLDFDKMSGGELDGSFGLFGVGVMHDFKQWIPGIKALPFDMSVFVGYTKMKLDIGVSQGGANGKTELSSSATTIQALISKKITVFTPYFGVGINMAKTELALKGDYDFDNNPLTTPTKDPFTFSTESNGPRATLGFRLKFGPLTLHGDYTLAKYNAASAGLGIAVR
jgi:hypothetical protein